MVILAHLQESVQNDLATAYARVLDKRLGRMVLDRQEEHRRVRHGSLPVEAYALSVNQSHINLFMIGLTEEALRPMSVSYFVR